MSTAEHRRADFLAAHPCAPAEPVDHTSGSVGIQVPCPCGCGCVTEAELDNKETA